MTKTAQAAAAGGGGDDYDPDALIEVLALVIKRAWQDGKKDPTARRWLMDGPADELLESLGFVDIDIAWHFRNGSRVSQDD